MTRLFNASMPSEEKQKGDCQTRKVRGGVSWDGCVTAEEELVVSLASKKSDCWRDVDHATKKIKHSGGGSALNSGGISVW